MRPSKYWAYEPSVALGVVSAVIFAILTLYHAFLLLRRRTWFCIPFIIGGLFEVIGFSARAIANSNLDKRPPKLIESLLILLAPILFAASVYMILGRIIRATSGEAYSIVRVNWLTKIFVGSDALCFAIQGVGGGMITSADNKDDKHKGEMIILAGLIIQMAIFGFFLAVAKVFHSRLRAAPTGKSRNIRFKWERFMNLLYTASILITLRNFFRVLEYAMGEDSYLLANEWPIYAFDALPMAVCLVVCTGCYVPFNQVGQQKIVDLELANNEHLITQPVASRH
ncbi:hypothetical protein IFR05_012608 [Cadophora sp. M221]|nr:hypothetical protein IFR05_012608 [Cadophora sp. M221]